MISKTNHRSLTKDRTVMLQKEKKLQETKQATYKQANE